MLLEHLTGPFCHANVEIKLSNDPQPPSITDVSHKMFEIAQRRNLQNRSVGCSWSLPSKHHIKSQPSKILITQMVSDLMLHRKGSETTVLKKMQGIFRWVFRRRRGFLFKMPLQFLWVQLQYPGKDNALAHYIELMKHKQFGENRTVMFPSFSC